MSTKRRVGMAVVVVLVILLVWAVRYSRQPVGPPPAGVSLDESAPEVDFGGQTEKPAGTN